MVRKQLAEVSNIEPQKVDRTHFRFIPVSDLVLKTPVYVVCQILEANALAAFFGDPGSTKSFLAIDISCCVATGIEFNGKTTTKGPVCYIAGEGQNGIARRIKAWAIRHDIELGSIANPSGLHSICKSCRTAEYSAYERRVSKSNPRFVLDRNIRVAIYKDIVRRGGNKNGRKWNDLVGYSTDELLTHLEKQFKPGMSWDNYGEWHVDHIIPRAAKID